MVIRLESLTKRFGSFTAVDGVHLEVDKGEICGLIGANGAGKTTLIRMICGILPPTKGKGTVLGYDMLKERKAIRDRLGYMSQKFSLYPDLTVEENLRFFAGVYTVDSVHRQVEERMDRFGLWEIRREQVSSLPGGWKQKVAFASATVHSPSLLILDEPTSGVDPITRRGFWDLLYGMAAEGMTVLVTTHYMDEAERCDRVAMMSRGRLIMEGTVAQLRSRNQSSLDRERPALEEIFIHMIGEESPRDGTR
ncbi:ABC transporter ATP-binding protein [Kroppenstedtia eburnea]|uniref:ABC-2 type transport system ATP-binding protein n=1 Tax=Kroppenstedtia eburnea TaxID=714067 RepID=A0A1N7Q2D8_9BACL|nr:ABC transporter ATP-binding protein [Kroppenstedtia eburnea]QKI82640.1 ABC transporter ATP-binding protein [Kroppenstedtia eburnea]SIT17020.1 ABC-2 type transport system ATP-binding protein [Kroppenstedtia eburnea]